MSLIEDMRELNTAEQFTYIHERSGLTAVEESGLYNVNATTLSDWVGDPSEIPEQYAGFIKRTSYLIWKLTQNNKLTPPEVRSFLFLELPEGQTFSMLADGVLSEVPPVTEGVFYYILKQELTDELQSFSRK